ncbi:MAG: M1 family metallopeptidase, partial [Bacillota bacterium]|nr:M1 family metallopeptidase [Bacillota bacterium]
QLPNRIGRFAWEDVSANFGNWYPIMAVYDDEGWNLDKYYEIGDPFYSETADYTVTLDIPEGMELASSGRAVSESASGGRQLINMEADMVRDFAFALSRKYTVSENDVDGVNVRVLTTPGDPYSIQAARDAATSSLKAFDSAFGQYAGDTLTVAFVDNVTGMEYPGIVFIDHTLLTGAHNVRFLKVCIVHEIAHQWWFSAVGNDEVDEPWLDESLTSFSEYVYIAYYRGWSRAAEAIERTRAELTQPLLLSLKDQESWEDYGVIYSFGPEFFLKLREELGGEIFDAMLREYYADYKYKVATTEDLRVLIVQAGNRDAIEWFDECVYGK